MVMIPLAALGGLGVAAFLLSRQKSAPPFQLATGVTYSITIHFVPNSSAGDKAAWVAKGWAEARPAVQNPDGSVTFTEVWSRGSTPILSPTDPNVFPSGATLLHIS
jgi:hypothetical protein